MLNVAVGLHNFEVAMQHEEADDALLPLGPAPHRWLRRHVRQMSDGELTLLTRVISTRPTAKNSNMIVSNDDRLVLQLICAHETLYY